MSALTWARGKIRLDHTRSEDTRKEAHIKPVETFPENKRPKYVVWPLLEARTQPHLFEITKPRGFWETEQGRLKDRWRDNIN